MSASKKSTKSSQKATPPKRLVDFSEVEASGEDWEAFARDFLAAEGFAIESPPDRGADGGKDLLVSERLSGTYSKYPFRWLVSCKHFASSGRAVSPKDEINLLERLRAFRADGFLGFYSTTPTSGLGNQLRALRDSHDLRDYKIFDARLIENHLVRIGYSHLLLRYFPVSYRSIKPLHRLTDEYRPLSCAACGDDILKKLHLRSYDALVGIARRREGGKDYIVDVYWACKGRCDRAVSSVWHGKRVMTGWEDISDLVIPAWYVRWCLTIMSRLRNGYDVYEDKAYDRMKYLIVALGQRVFREQTEEEMARLKVLIEMPML
ncbi:restriction endonuclease [Sorangium sp. So ce145]|uniref:restriction endonuclease n=1 Tax=Sorangium sp. So ce145 TaxID=3133285 RepID=UPI003F641417